MSDSTHSGIDCRGLDFRYGGHVAVSALDLCVEPGSIYGLLGPNGAGKTTTIKVLTGLLLPQSGRIFVGGHELQNRPREARLVSAYVPDKAHLYERLSGWEYLDFVASLWGLDGRTSWRDQARKDLARFQLEEDADRLLESYSQGMRQKLIFVAGRIHQPKVWILDEPMSGLDPRSARVMRDILKEEAAGGAAILLSTHTLDLAERLCDRIGIIDKGRKIAEGSLEELQELASRRDAESRRLEDLFLKLTEGGPTP